MEKGVIDGEIVPVVEARDVICVAMFDERLAVPTFASAPGPAMSCSRYTYIANIATFSAI